MADKKTGSKSNHEQIIAKLNQLRQEQAQIINTIGVLEADLAEHNAVLDTLKTVNSDRKCFRKIGDVLVERSVGEVLPGLNSNRDMIQQRLDQLKTQMVSKGEELNRFCVDNKIQFRRADNDPRDATTSNKNSSGVVAGGSSGGGPGLLVS